MDLAVFFNLGYFEELLYITLHYVAEYHRAIKNICVRENDTRKEKFAELIVSKKLRFWERSQQNQI